MNDEGCLDSSMLAPRFLTVAKNWGLTRNLSCLIHAMEEFGIGPRLRGQPLAV